MIARINEAKGGIEMNVAVAVECREDVYLHLCYGIRIVVCAHAAFSSFLLATFHLPAE